MRIIPISNSGIKTLSAIYADTTVNIDNNIEVTQDGYILRSTPLHTNSRDIVNTEDTLALLSSFSSLSSLVSLNLPVNNTNIFLTFLQDNNRAYVQKNLTDEYTNISPTIEGNCIFEIIFLDELTAQIRYNDNGILKYLSVLPNTNVLGFSNINNPSLQTFYYLFDKLESQLSLFIIQNNIAYSVRIFANSLQLYTDTSFNSQNIFKTRSFYSVFTLQQPMTHNWVCYNTDVDVQSDRSVRNCQNNFLEFINFHDIDVDNGSMTIEFLPLKNQLTNNSNLSRGNIFNAEDETTQRLYYTLHLDGNDIIPGYICGTNQLIFPADKLTYFRFPYISSPFVVLNINDSSLVTAGAIAGDTPLNSDKVFKQQSTDYKDYLITGEQNGTWLCAWLSGSSTPNVKPVWVDRYFNPNFISFTNALGYNKTPFYIDENTNIIMDNQKQNYIVFDLLSKLVFEPHALYAYHHIGNKDLLQRVNTKIYNLLVSGADIYQDSNTSIDLNPNINNNISTYTFTGSELLLINPLSSQGSFTLSFNLYTDNYQYQFSDQLIGNYTGAGIGIFNDQEQNLNVLLGITYPGSVNADQLTLSYNLSSLSNGWHNFVITLNTEQGRGNLYVDSISVDEIIFAKGLYTFSTLFNNSLSAGLSAKNYQLKDIRIYNVCFPYFDIRNLAYMFSNIRDINWCVPTGQRNFIDTIERFFKFTVPGQKTNMFNIVIQNSAITDLSVRKIIEDNVVNIIQTTAPIYTKLNKIIWKEKK